MDILIDKPPRVRGYALHRIVEQFRQGKPALWADEGAQLRIRPCEAQPPAHPAGTLLGFTTTACVALRDGRRFTVDATEFTGLLRVTEPEAFARCLVNGIGRVGKAFGLNLLIVQ